MRTSSLHLTFIGLVALAAVFIPSTDAAASARMRDLQHNTNAAAAYHTMATVPDAPTITSATPASGQANITWTAPANNGGATITSYKAISSPGGYYTVTSGTVFSAIVTGLTNGVAYTFTVTATNSVGTSAASSPSSAITFYSVPYKPTSVFGSAGAQQVSVSFTPGGNGGYAVSGYTVTASPSGITATGTASPIVVTGLTNGQAYTFTVYATNQLGDSPLSSPSSSVTPRTVPDAPTVTSATSTSAGQATVNFTAPAWNGGATITSYRVTSSPGGLTKTGSTLSLTVTGLTNGVAYTFTVLATNTAGNSVPSAASNSVTPVSVPYAPTGVSGTAGANQVSVSFTAPGNGGYPITSYTVTSNPSGITATGTASPIVVTGLTNGQAYTFTVYATNQLGNGAPSSASSSVTPRTVPDAPTMTGATASNAQAVVTFTAPSWNGGSAITSYKAISSPGGLYKTGTTTSLTVTGLTNGVEYTFTVIAINAAGNSAPSAASNAVTPMTTPSTPSSVVGTAGAGQVSVAFTPNSNGGATATYTVTSSPGGIVATGSASPIIVTGLTNGVAYTFTVYATNVVGNSGTSSASYPVTPRTTPDAPTITGVTRGNGQVTVTYTAPAFNGGSTITGYKVTSSPGGLTRTISFQYYSLTVFGLTNGVEYTFTVQALNVAGYGTPSAPSSPITPATVPGAPTVTSFTVSNGTITVYFDAPASNGGMPITQYKLSSNAGDFVTGLTSPLSLTGLINGQEYVPSVAAINVVGSSYQAYLPDGYATPVSPPLPPVITAVYSCAASAVVSVDIPDWTQENGPIVSYTVTAQPGDIVLTTDQWPLIVTGLTLGNDYTFSATVSNPGYTSDASNISAPLTITNILTPLFNYIEPRNNSVQAYLWTMEESHGCPQVPATYTITTLPDNLVITNLSNTDVWPVQINGLTNYNAYTFTAVATRLSDNYVTAPSDVYGPVTPKDPYWPYVPVIDTIQSLAPGNVTITFLAYDWDVTYVATSNPLGLTGTSIHAQPITIVGLNSGDSYNFTVVATNAYGTSPASAPSANIVVA